MTFDLGINALEVHLNSQSLECPQAPSHHMQQAYLLQCVCSLSEDDDDDDKGHFTSVSAVMIILFLRIGSIQANFYCQRAVEMLTYVVSCHGLSSGIAKAVIALFSFCR